MWSKKYISLDSDIKEDEVNNPNSCNLDNAVIINRNNESLRGNCVLWSLIPESKGCTADTFKGMSSIERKRFDKTSKAASNFPENVIGSEIIKKPFI